MPGYMMKDKKKKKMYGYGGEIKKKKNVEKVQYIMVKNKYGI